MFSPPFSSRLALRRPHALMLSLGLGLGLGCASAPPVAPKSSQEVGRRLLISPALDLSLRQEGERAWLRELMRRTNLELSELNLSLELGPERPWELSDQEEALGLEQLWGSLSAQLEDWRAAEPRAQPRLWLALTSSPPPSYPPLRELSHTRRGAPLVILRQLRGLSGVTEDEALTAMSRLLARSIAVNLGALKGCEADALSLSRDELLGWRLNRAEPPQPSRAPSRAPRLRGAQRSSSLQARRERDRSARSLSSAEASAPTLTPITWSQLNRELSAQRLRELSGAPSVPPCERLSALDLSCSLTLNEARLYTHACLTEAEDWVRAARGAELSPPPWEEERRLARGAAALLEERWAEALERCAPIASHSPSSFASRCAGEAAAQLKRDAEALRYLRAYLSAHPLNPPATLELSKVVGRTGDHSAAAALLSELISAPKLKLSSQQRSRALYNLGIAHAQLGELSEALKAWRAIDPKDESYGERAQSLINELSAQ